MTPEIIAAIFAGINGLVVAIGWIYLQRIARQVAVTKDLTVKADETLDVVVNQGNGMRTELLDRVAALERMLSAVSGNTIRADNAQQAATDHRAATEHKP